MALASQLEREKNNKCDHLLKHQNLGDQCELHSLFSESPESFVTLRPLFILFHSYRWKFYPYLKAQLLRPKPFWTSQEKVIASSLNEFHDYSTFSVVFCGKVHAYVFINMYIILKICSVFNWFLKIFIL